ncbi:hypothetical protein MMG61_RS25435, partial [Escherichia coli]
VPAFNHVRRGGFRRSPTTGNLYKLDIPNNRKVFYMVVQKNCSGTGKPADRSDIPNTRKHIPEKNIRPKPSPAPSEERGNSNNQTSR